MSAAKKPAEPKFWFPHEYMVLIKYREPVFIDEWRGSSAPRFDTWTEAHEWKVTQALQNIKEAEKTLAAAHRNLRKVQAMKAPADSEGGEHD